MIDTLTEVTKLLHFDPVNAGIVIVGIYVVYLLLQKDSGWHTEWIKKHDAECDLRRKESAEILVELRESNARLCTLTEGHHDRIGRLENQMDKKR